MNPRYRQPAVRPGFTLLEVMTTVALSATLMASSFMVMRSSYASWQAHEADLDRAGNTIAVLKHLVRHARQADVVAEITPTSDASGALTIVTSEGSTYRWNHSGTDITLSVNAGAAQPLAEDILELSFEGYRADGETLTTNPEDVKALRAIVKTQQPAGGTRKVSSFTWIRSW